jgi:hypothetical protein
VGFEHASATDSIAALGIARAVEAATGQRRLLQQVNLPSCPATLADEQCRRGQSRDAGADDPGLTGA